MGVGYLWISVIFFYICQIFLNICSHLSSPLHQTTGVSPLVQQLPHRGSGSSLAKCEIVSFSIKAWQEDCLESSKREYIFKPGMQFVLSARRTLTGLPDIGSYKVSQRSTTTTTIRPSTLWSQQVDAYPALNKYQHERMIANISFAGFRCLPIIATVMTVWFKSDLKFVKQNHYWILGLNIWHTKNA